jgi:hypothetical protein
MVLRKLLAQALTEPETASKAQAATASSAAGEHPSTRLVNLLVIGG